MQLTRYTDYGLRILIYLALLPKGQRASIDEISNIYGVSRNNVNKIVHQLGKAEVIATMRGKGGGIALKMAPSQINVGDMVLLMENSMEIINCQSPVCNIMPVCQLKNVLAKATEAFVATLKSYTLNDLVSQQKNDLKYILHLDG